MDRVSRFRCQAIQAWSAECGTKIPATRHPPPFRSVQLIPAYSSLFQRIFYRTNLMSRKRVRLGQTLRARRWWVAGGFGPQSQSAGGYVPSSRLASNPPTPGALIPYHESDSYPRPEGQRGTNQSPKAEIREPKRSRGEKAHKGKGAWPRRQLSSAHFRLFSSARFPRSRTLSQRISAYRNVFFLARLTTNGHQ